MPIDYDLFAKKICEYLKIEKKNVSDLKSKQCGKFGCWGIIQTSIYGCYNRLQSLELYSAWKNKNRNIRTRIINMMNRNKENESSSDESKNNSEEEDNNSDQVVKNSDESENNENYTTDNDFCSSSNSSTEVSLKSHSDCFLPPNEDRKILIKISGNEWQRMQTMLTGKRLSFKVEFANNLSIRLQQAGVKCWLKNIYNYITQSKNRNPPYFWKGLYRCIDSKCESKFRCHIKDEPIKSGIINISWPIVPINHEKLKKVKRLSGNERKQTGKNLMIYGNKDVRNKNIILNRDNINDQCMPNVTNANVLKMAKYECRHLNRFSTDLFIDAQATKAFYESKIINKQNDCFNGYLHDIRQDKFGLLFYSEKQFKIWTYVQRLWPIWFIDATGGILKKIKGQKKVLLYSIVMHDKNNKFICPLADFFSSAHDSKTISSYFLLIKDELEKFIPKPSFQQAPIIVTDFSWGLINAVIRTFNNCSFDAYIAWCADLLINKTIWKIHMMPTILFLCYSHFIKMIAKKIKKVKKYRSKQNNQKLYQVALYSCAVLQQSQTMDDFSENLKNCFYIFNFKYESNVKKSSLKALRQKVINGSLDKNFGWKKFTETKNQQKTTKNVIYLNNSNHQSYRRNSLFLSYFTKLIKNCKNNIKAKTAKRVKTNYRELNNYFCPKMFKIIFNYVHLMPLWSNVLISIFSNYFNLSIDRLTNNPCENWFDQLKESLRLFIPAMPSQFANFAFSLIEAFYDQQPNLKSIKLKKYYDFNKESTEQWSKKHPGSFRREKNFYNNIKTNNNAFDDIFESDNKKRKRCNQKYQKNRKRRRNDFSSCDDFEENENEEKNEEENGDEDDDEDDDEDKKENKDDDENEKDNKDEDEEEEEEEDEDDDEYDDEYDDEDEKDNKDEDEEEEEEEDEDDDEYDDEDEKDNNDEKENKDEKENEEENDNEEENENDDENSIEEDIDGQHNLSKQSRANAKVVYKQQKCFLPNYKKTIFGINKDFYFLKLINDSNCCYANAAIQCFLSCGTILFEQVQMVLNTLNSKECIEYFLVQFIDSFKNQTREKFTSRRLREFMDTKDKAFRYSKNRQNDSFNFFCDIIELCDARIKNLFLVNETVERQCLVCNLSKQKTTASNFIGLQRKRKGVVSFQELFLEKSRHEDSYCDKCKKNTNHDGNVSFNCSSQSKFIIIRIDLSHTCYNKYVRYKMRIRNLNPDKIEIPGMNEKFILKSAIIHKQSAENKNKGHYTAIVRNKNKWFNISDSEGAPACLNKDLKDFFVLLLERL